MSTDFARTQRAQNDRTVKADKISAFMLDAGGIWPDNDTDRRKVEKLAGVRQGSEMTWQLARLMYDDVIAHRPSVAS